MNDWLSNKEGLKEFKRLDLNQNDKRNYVWFLVYRSLYNEFTEGNFTKAIKDLQTSSKLFLDLPDDYELRFNLYANKAQILAYRGNLEDAKKSLLEIYKIPDASQKKMDIGLLKFMEAKIFLEQGDYSLALKTIDEGIKFEEKNLPKDQYSTSSLILRAEILIRQQNFAMAHELLNKLYKHSKTVFINDHEQQAKILTWLAICEANLGHVEQGLKLILEAQNIFRSIPERKIIPINESIDFDLAAALVVEGDIYFLMNEFKKAFTSYESANTIYQNRYKDKLRLDHIGYLYFKLAQVGLKNNHLSLYKKYLLKLETIFGLDYNRILELYKFNITPNEKL